MASKEVLSALESLHRELEKLEPAIKHVELAQQVTKMVEDIPQKHLDLQKELKDNDIQHKEELKDLFSKELIGITEENKVLSKTTMEIQQQIKIELEALKKLGDTVQAFHERIEKINFPERLDKLDANVAGIMAAVQSVQSRLDGIERNIADRLRDLYDYQKETRNGLQAKIDQSHTSIIGTIENGNKKRLINSIITWALIVLGVIAIIIIKSI